MKFQNTKTQLHIQQFKKKAIKETKPKEGKVNKPMKKTKSTNRLRN